MKNSETPALMSIEILALLKGKVMPLSNGAPSAIAKTPIQGSTKIGYFGVAGDEQADLHFHGGPDKALHHYPAEHYARWQSLVVAHPLLQLPGAFGENISTLGLLEDQVCIGDRFRCGNALVEISQGREPCWKQALRMEWSMLPKLMTNERRCGWYYRVIEEGVANAGDTLDLVDRVLPDWSVKRVFGLLIGGDWKSEPEALPQLAAMETLFDGWRHHAIDLMRQHAQ